MIPSAFAIEITVATKANKFQAVNVFLTVDGQVYVPLQGGQGNGLRMRKNRTLPSAQTRHLLWHTPGETEVGRVISVRSFLRASVPFRCSGREERSLFQSSLSVPALPLGVFQTM